MAGHKKSKGSGAASSTPLSRPPESIVATTIAQTLAENVAAPHIAGAVSFPARSLFPGLGAGPRMHKAAKVTAYDPPPVITVTHAPTTPNEPPPPSSKRPGFEHEPPTAPDRPVVQPSEAPPRAAPPRPSRREPDPPPTSGSPPFPVISAPPFAAAHANAYGEDFQSRERERWGKTKQVPQPDTKLVHCWTAALVHFPPTALTLWLTRTSPAQGAYEIWISGEELFDPVFPDRKLYEVTKRKRRQPTIAESFVGRIRGVSENGSTYDCGYGEIHLPPEEAAPPAPPWGSAGMAPWGQPMPPGYGPPPYGSPWGSGWGSPPGWGGPPPPWAQAWGAPQPPPPAPAAVQSDPLLLQVWQASAEATANAQRMSADNAARASDNQAALLKILLERVLTPAAQPQTGGMGETMRMLKDFAGFVETVRGPREEGGGSGKGITIHSLGNGERLVEDKNGDIDVGATVGLGIKSGITELAAAVGKLRAQRPGPSMTQAPPAATVGAALSGARMNKAPPPAGSETGAPNGAVTQ